MQKHYSEADLLETYYMQPGESMPVMMHLAACPECEARYHRLERKLREAVTCGQSEKPETFWTRQRLSIMRRVEKHQHASPRLRTWRGVAAATLAFVLGGAVMYQTSSDRSVTTQPEVTTAQVATAALPPVEDPSTVPPDPWAAEELHDFAEVVEWESWVDDQKVSGGTSL